MKRQTFIMLLAISGILGTALVMPVNGQDMQSDQSAQAKTQARTADQNYPILKSYTLRYIKAEEFLRAARLYCNDATFHGSTITVRIWPHQIADFEKLLATLDVEPKTVLLRVYPIYARRKQEAASPGSLTTSVQETTADVDAELKKVVGEMNSLWKFDQYKVLGQSFIQIKETAGPDSYRLVATWPLTLLVADLRVSGSEPGKRTISIGQLRFSQPGITPDFVYIDTHDVVLKEKGYLVVGVAGVGGQENAVILMINAEIK